MLRARFFTSTSLVPVYLALAVGLGGGNALAQTEPADVSADPVLVESSDPMVADSATPVAPNYLGEEILVTAQKRSERLQDIPATITAFSERDLEIRQIRDLGDLTSRVPSLQLGYTFGSSLITLRGISTNLTSGFEDPSVAVHVNGVYQARSRSLNLAFMDLERIEVLSGPQGTLYGRNATGGVVNYILRGPTPDMEAEVVANVGNYETYGLRGYVSGPLSDTVGFRVAGLWSNQNKGYTRNLLEGAPRRRFGESEVIAMRGVLAFEPTSNLRIDLEGSFSDTKGSYAPTALAPIINPFYAALAGTQTFLPRRVYSELDPRQDTKTYAANATITWDIGDNVTLRSISAYQRYENEMVVDYDSSSAIIQTIPSSGRSDTFTQELNLTTQMFDNRLQSIYGLYYFNDDVAQTTRVLSSAFGGNNVQVFRGDFTQQAESIAFFTDHTFSVTDRFRLIAGLRYNSDTKDGVFTTPACQALTASREDEAWTPRAGVQFDVTEDVMTYANYQRGYKAGGFGAGTCGDDYDPERIEGGEVGIKLGLLDNRVRLDIAGYYYDYTNLQVQQTLGFVGGFEIFNAAEARIKGLEATLSAALTNRLRLDIAGMVQSAKYTDFVNCDQSVFLGACSATDPRPITDPSRNQDLSGNWLNRAPPYSINVGLQYTADVPGGELTLRAESFWSGRTYFNEFNGPILSQRAYNLQNAYATFESEDERYVVRAFIKNIGNVDYKNGAYFQAFTGQDTGTWNPPRTFGVELGVRF